MQNCFFFISKITFQISSNRLFHFGADKSVRMMGRHIPVYMYYYTFKNSFALAEIFAGKMSDLLGVAHGDDVFLLYSAKPALHDLRDGEKSMQTHLLDMYESYTATGYVRHDKNGMSRAFVIYLKFLKDSNFQGCTTNESSR